MTDEVRFYFASDPYAALSNFARYPITLNGRTWPTSEHYYQAQKHAGTEIEEAIRLADSPMAAAGIGRSPEHRLRPDWESVRDDVMREAVMAKFSQHPELRALLLSTGSSRIVEASPTDTYWGCGADGSGRNRLGEILMEVRETLRQRYDAGLTQADQSDVKETPTVSRITLTLSLLEQHFALVRLDPEAGIPTWAARGAFWSVTRNSSDVSVVCAEDAPPDFVSAERGWRTLKIEGALSFADVGILESVTHPLADAGISIFIVSAYDTAYVLVRDDRCDDAVAALEAYGHSVQRG